MTFPDPLVVVPPLAETPLQESAAFKRPNKGLNDIPEQSQINIPLPRAVARRMEEEAD